MVEIEFYDYIENNELILSTTSDIVPYVNERIFIGNTNSMIEYSVSDVVNYYKVVEYQGMLIEKKIVYVRKVGRAANVY